MNKSLLLCIIAATCFGIAPTFIQLSMQAGFAQTTCVLFNNLILMLLCAALCAAGRLSLRIPLGKIVALVLMGISGMCGTVLLLATSYAYISVGTATVVQFLYPAIVTVACAIFMHRKLHWPAYLSILLSILGLLFISVIGTSGTSFQPVGLLLALAAAFTYSFYIFGNEYFHIDEIPVWVAVFYMSGASTVVMLLVNAFSGSFRLPSTVTEFGLVGGMVLMSALGFLLLNIGIAGVGAAQASFATLIEPIAAVLCGVVVLHEKLTVFSIIGIVLILASVWVNSMPVKEKQH